ncbi:MAG: hypothetical protein LBH21_08885 [Gracilibacteraceae bacterium]|jgi:hypothetical protein|nr:hypothetical protein [Gracilibacteraceae bacterium]
MFTKNKLSVAVKIGVIVLVCALGLVVVACGKKKQQEQPAPPVQPPVQETTPAAPPEGGETVGLPNPVVESTPAEIKEMLGFEFNAPDEFADAAIYSVINKEVASLTYVIESDKGNPVTVVYRAARTEADDALRISGDHTAYPKTETITLSGGQQISVNTSEGTGPALLLWYNANVVGGGLSASLLVDPAAEAGVLQGMAEFFVEQESKGF